MKKEGDIISKFWYSKYSKDIIVSKDGEVYSSKTLEPFQLAQRKHDEELVIINGTLTPKSKVIIDTFIGDFPADINYKSGDKKDCSISNLSYDIEYIKEIGDSLDINGVEFRKVRGYRPIYWVSADGIVYSSYIRAFLIKLLTSAVFDKFDAYETVHMILLNNPHKNWVRSTFIHKLVYETWVGDVPNGMVIDHIDCNKRHNHYTNLEVVTSQENARRAAANDLCGNRFRKFDQECVRKVCEYMSDNNNHSIEEFIDICNLPYTSKNVKSVNELISGLLSNKAYAYISKDYDLSNFKLGVSQHSITGAKLTTNDVIDIWNLRDHNISPKEIASRYNVHEYTIQRIFNQETWKHITSKL